MLSQQQPNVPPNAKLLATIAEQKPFKMVTGSHTEPAVSNGDRWITDCKNKVLYFWMDTN
jgi:hypothetical protein